MLTVGVGGEEGDGMRNFRAFPLMVQKEEFLTRESKEE